jgi:hypothetical protein
VQVGAAAADRGQNRTAGLSTQRARSSNSNMCSTGRVAMLIPDDFGLSPNPYRIVGQTLIEKWPTMCPNLHPLGRDHCLVVNHPASHARAPATAHGDASFVMPAGFGPSVATALSGQSGPAMTADRSSDLRS